jgi:hypothetical protein
VWIEVEIRVVNRQIYQNSSAVAKIFSKNPS